VSGAAHGAFVALALLGGAVLLVTVRLGRGPGLPDRVVALDLLGTLAVGIMAAWAVAAGDPVYLDVALLVALATFVGTVAFARYSETGGDE
jgi:multicomponent Na+:H+ antiporter subunit F